MESTLYFLGFLLLDSMLARHRTFSTNAKTIPRIVGMVHHMPTLALCFFVLMDPLFWQDKINHSSWLSHRLVDFAVGYFLYDTHYHIVEVVETRPNTNILFMIHGYFCLSVFHYIHRVEKGHFFAAAFLTWEASTPFYYAIHYMNKKSIWYTLTSVCFVFTFFTFRIAFGSYVFYGLVWPLITWQWKLIGLTLNGLNYYWGAKILKKAIA